MSTSRARPRGTTRPATRPWRGRRASRPPPPQPSQLPPQNEPRPPPARQPPPPPPQNERPQPQHEARAPARTTPRAEGNGAAPASRGGFLAVHGVEKSFVGRKVVKGVSLYVRKGEAVGLLGPNGAGKTTVFYMITGLITADHGRIELDGHDVTEPADVSARPPRHRLSAAGSLDLPRPQCRGEHPRGARGGRAQRQAARARSQRAARGIQHHPAAQDAVDRALRRRAPPRRDRPRAGDAAELHAARRAVRRHRSDRGRRHPERWCAI